LNNSLKYVDFEGSYNITVDSMPFLSLLITPPNPYINTIESFYIPDIHDVYKYSEVLQLPPSIFKSKKKCKNNKKCC
jgi:hypothetical protein